MENKTKFLWLSDIHIKSIYGDNVNFQSHELLKLHCEEFIDFIKHNHSDTNYLILSGDIAFSGSKEDYELFEILILNPLKKIIPDIEIIAVPGNHDIKRDDAEFFISSISDKKSAYSMRTDLINSNFEKFIFPFNDYKQFVQKHKINNRTGMHDSNLFGWQVDEKRKIVFILLNSAWFSIGDKFNELIFNHIKKKENESNLSNDEKINLALNIKDKIAEFGNQLIADSKIAELELEQNVFQKYKDHTVITIMHHPIHWLSWFESYGLTRDEQAEKSLFLILKNSNFFLTGHEHIPTQIPPETIYDKVLHIKSGCFLEELSKTSKLSKIKHNRFSILEIHKNRENTLTESRYIFDYSPKDIHNPKTLSVNISEDKESQNKQKVFYHKTHPLDRSLFALNSEVQEKFLQKKFPSVPIVKTSSIYNSFHNNSLCLYVFMSNESTGCDSLAFNQEFSDNLDKLFTDFQDEATSAKKILFHIIGFDFQQNRERYKSVFEPNVHSDMKKAADRNKIFHQLKTIADLKFNRFKYEYFIRAEESSDKGIHSNVSIELLLKTGMVFHFIPYWTI